MFHLSAEVIKESELIDTLYNMLKDRDPQVVANCIHVLDEIMREEGGMAINQPIIHHLLNRVKEFNEWGQCTVMELVSRYSPQSQDETFAIMNLLDVCLRVSNSAVVLATTKCFLQLTQHMPEIQQQVFIRLKTPLLTLMSSSTPELSYCVLSHVALIVSRAGGVFDDEYKQFFCGCVTC